MNSVATYYVYLKDNMSLHFRLNHNPLIYFWTTSFPTNHFLDPRFPFKCIYVQNHRIHGDKKICSRKGSVLIVDGDGVEFAVLYDPLMSNVDENRLKSLIASRYKVVNSDFD